jgi:hypothetical protein
MAMAPLSPSPPVRAYEVDHTSSLGFARRAAATRKAPWKFPSRAESLDMKGRVWFASGRRSTGRCARSFSSINLDDPAIART